MLPRSWLSFELEDALSLVVFILPVTCSVSLSLLVAAIGLLAFSFCLGERANHLASFTIFSYIQAVLAALMDPASIPLFFVVVIALVTRTCLCVDGSNGGAQFGHSAWLIGWTLTLATGVARMFQGSSMTIEELLPVMGRDSGFGIDMLHRSISVIVIDVGVSILGSAIEYWMVPFRNSFSLLYRIGERQLLVVLACIIPVMVGVSSVIRIYFFHSFHAISDARGLIGVLYVWWQLLHIRILFSVSIGHNIVLLLKVLPWCLHHRSSGWSWSLFIHEALAHEYFNGELTRALSQDSQLKSGTADALVIGASASASPGVRTLGHVVLEAGGLIRTQRGQQETLFQLIRSRNQELHIEQVFAVPRTYARIRVSFDDEHEVRRIVKEIARERGQRVNVKRVEVVYESPRD